ncbi:MULTISPECIES: sugar ABC transporter ATP-binding protein [unclassified Leucobacter]|uniref:sugar ABC transporter ATP-binding protein n=1 Tax=unclassified Leucobacter TaxID=2621730 RepID=UPI00165D9BBF|nr:sugar ABC transporter ATP-binding protein [Leucobacter sp. CX169]MBC9928378.1 sugar ABC transporter ATP-binding protein [Leucobacter sp. cx-169]
MDEDRGAAPLLVASGVTKWFGKNPALGGVDFTVTSGKVHALLGHNGAGKSTLISLLSGAQQQDGGEIVVQGATPDRWTPASAIEHGIAVIYQHLSLIDSLDVADNIFLGRERRSRWGIDRATQHREAAAMLRRLGATCDTSSLVGSLTTAQKQLVEIAKALQRDARVLILDEPTAALSSQESDALGGLIETLKAQGMGIVYVTHLIGEVQRLADEVTVLEGGKVQFHGDIAEIGFDALVALLSHGNARSAPLAERSLGVAALEATAIRGDGFGPVDLAVRASEIVVAFGMLGSGRGEMLRAIAGAQPFTGQLATQAGPHRQLSVRSAQDAGIFYVGPDRRRDGLFRTNSTFDNLLMSSFAPLAQGLRSSGREQAHWERARAAVALADIPETPVGNLSGGNQQKVVVGRVLAGARTPRVLLLDEPTQGVDIGARADIYRAIATACERDQVGVIVSTNDPEEAVLLADRILVFGGGRITAELRRGEFDETRIVALASQPSGAEPEGSLT